MDGYIQDTRLFFRGKNIKNTKGGFSIYIIEHESIDFVNRNIRYGLNRPVISLR